MGYRSQEIVTAAREFASLSEALKGISQVFLATAKSGKWKRDFFIPDASRLEDRYFCRRGEDRPGFRPRGQGRDHR